MASLEDRKMIELDVPNRQLRNRRSVTLLSASVPAASKLPASDSTSDQKPKLVAENSQIRRSRTRNRMLRSTSVLSSSTNPVLAYFFRHQISFPITIISILLAIHIFLPFQHITSKFFFLSHRVEHSGKYVKGPDDLYFIFLWVLLFTFIRAFSMDYVFIPVASYSGVTSSKPLIRFAEQAWSFCYYCLFSSFGLYLMYNSSYWFNTNELWVNWPHREQTDTFKCYYLAQIAFWLQQIFVLNIEQRRKDFHQMFTHHIVTCLLLIASYNYCFTRIGNVVLCIMDFGDIFLSFAKMLKYMGYQTICDFMFGVFIVNWIIGRHVLYIKLLLSAMFDAPILIGYKCVFDPLDDVVSIGDSLSTSPNKTRVAQGEEQCFTELVHYAFIGLMWILQIVTLIWLYMILKVAIKVLSGNSAEDSRSDDEDELIIDEDETEFEIEDENDGVEFEGHTFQDEMDDMDEKTLVDESIALTSTK
ncbi:TLC domain-containing protein [Dipodascopsis uninucleata]